MISEISKQVVGGNSMPERATQLTYVRATYENYTFHFTYDIDGNEFTIDLTHSIHSTLSTSSIEAIGFNLGMCYLMDIAEIVLPEMISVYRKLPDLALVYWKKLFEEVVVEKLYEHKLPTRFKHVTWEHGDEAVNLRIEKLPKDRDHAAVCLTGGKESLSIFKTLKDKKPLLLFFLNPEMNAHRRKVYGAVKDQFLTVKSISNRQDILDGLEAKYSEYSSGVDMAHLVFNTMLYSDKCEYLLIGNEYSASYPNAIYEGHVVNHQYVKTIHFAEQINRYVHQFVTEDFSYYSPFFGMYELLISDLLFKDDEYLDVWTSCNRTTAEINFCGHCHKCAFTYLIARLKKPDEYLSRFFSRDMMQDVALFRPLVDFTGVKPLDCVGDKAEVWACLELLHRKGLQNPVIDYYLEHIRPEIEHQIDDDIKQVTSVQRVALDSPKELQDIFHTALGVSATE